MFSYAILVTYTWPYCLKIITFFLSLSLPPSLIWSAHVKMSSLQQGCRGDGHYCNLGLQDWRRVMRSRAGWRKATITQVPLPLMQKRTQFVHVNMSLILKVHRVYARNRENIIRKKIVSSWPILNVLCDIHSMMTSLYCSNSLHLCAQKMRV